MAGYLRQLARQVLQPGSPLHSVAALAYSTPPELVQEETRETTALVVTQAARGRAIAQEPGHAAPTAKRDAPWQPPIEPTRSRSMQATQRSPPLANATLIPVHNEPKPAVEAPVISASERTAAVADVRPTPAPSPAVPLRTDTNPQREHRSANAILIATTPRVRFSTERRESVADPLAAGADHAPEVHIHIGRIELTAISPSAPSKRDRESKKPMSLDEYLSRRGGKAP